MQLLFLSILLCRPAATFIMSRANRISSGPRPKSQAARRTAHGFQRMSSSLSRRTSSIFSPLPGRFRFSLTITGRSIRPPLLRLRSSPPDFFESASGTSCPSYPDYTCTYQSGQCFCTRTLTAPKTPYYSGYQTVVSSDSRPEPRTRTCFPKAVWFRRTAQVCFR